MGDKQASFVTAEEILAHMQQWQVPGVSIGIVHHGEVVFLDGFGYRDVAGKREMTKRTVLPIGSATKSFTALTLGMLADEGRFDFDAPVREYIPWFQLYDKPVSDRVTTRDLLCHRTGVPSHDVHGVFCTKTRKEMVADIRYLQPSTDFRYRLQYQNQMVMAAGHVLETITGKTWEAFVQERVFDKLGMERSVFSIEAMQAFDDHSKPYVQRAEGPSETNYIPIVPVGPAGAINSTAEDMVKYLQLQLGRGQFNGEALVSEANLAQMHAPQMLGSPYLWKLDEFQAANYGFCWFVDVYRGHKMVSHGGNTRGFSSLVTLLPGQDFGIVMLSNADTSFMIYALTYTIIDRLLGLPALDWSAKIKAELDKLFAGMGMMMEQRAKARIPDTVCSHPLEAYAGEYMHPAYGEFKITTDGAALFGTYNGGALNIAHYHYDTFDIVIKAMDLPYQITFETNAPGAIDRLTVPFEPSPGVDPIVFMKKPAIS